MTGQTLRVVDLEVPRGGRPVLHGVSLDVPSGEITTLLGPNGAGKSTLVLTIGGVLRATSGSVMLGDRDLTKAKPERVRAAGVAVVPEGRRLLPNLSVTDNLRVATYSLPRDEA
ncbi:MAG: ATP-binding cassette domain-containing protein, partial [Actinobacteria bacterium]|nr:ATP-binding cassette domain-containing protein [Actinomycetota bacterium]